MKINPSPPDNRHLKARAPRGFALVIAVTLMVLLTIIAVGFLSLSSVTLRSSSIQQNSSIARANARMALCMAIAQLQKYAGKDQVVTAESGILDRGSSSSTEITGIGASGGKQLRWTGVWDSAAANQKDQESLAGKPLTWLVSGEDSDPDPMALTSAQTVVIANDPGTQGSSSSTSGVRVPLVDIKTNANQAATGRYAYWISDQGVKARINLSKPVEGTITTSNNREQVARTVTAAASELRFSGEEFTKVTDEQKQKILSFATSSLVASGTDPELPRKYQHDLTVEGYGLPVDVSAGGFKKDLTTIFEKTTYCTQYLGGSVSGTSMTASDPKKFFLVDSYVTKKVGPNWGSLFSYYNQYKVTDTKFVPPSPGGGIEMRINDYAPYNNSSRVFGIDNYVDTQHLNSPMTPIVALLRMNFRLGAVEVTNPEDKTKKAYQIRLHVKPIVALWNPYNYRLEMEQDLSFSWGTFPYLKLKITDTKGTRDQKLWLREIALNSGTVSNPPRNYSDLIIPASIGKFEPGEMKVYSINSIKQLGSINTLDNSSLNYKADFFAPLKDGLTKKDVLAYDKSATIKVTEMYLDDMQTPETKTRWSALDPKTNSGSYLAIKHNNFNLVRYAGLWAPEQTGKRLTPGKVDVGSVPPQQVSALLTNTADPLMAWEIRVRTSDNTYDPARMFVDGNPRAIAWNAKWDGSTATAGWRYAATLQGGGDLRDGVSLSPSTDQFDKDMRLRGGNSPTPGAGGGKTHIVLFDVPRSPLVSLAQFQHANLCQYQFEPTYVVGHSYANVRMLDASAVQKDNYAGFSGFTLVDSPYLLNRKLWDSYFLSSWSAAFRSTSATPPKVESQYPLEKLVSGEIELPNSRHKIRKIAAEKTFDEILSSATKGYEAEAVASRIAVEGAFNVNSTSVLAWKTMLSSLVGGKIPKVKLTANGKADLVEITDDKVARFSRFASVTQTEGSTATATEDGFWKSFRKLDSTEVETLAREIVTEVKARGPFLSLAEFINRNPKASDPAQQRAGALQTALDRALNSKISDVEAIANVPGMNDAALDLKNENQAAGAPGYLSQADVLQAIGPILQPRSDCFRIRVIGQALDKTGTVVVAQAACEAYIQRGASYVDTSNAAELPPADASNPTQPNSNLTKPNQNYGRKFNMLSFRWLHPSEI